MRKVQVCRPVRHVGAIVVVLIGVIRFLDISVPTKFVIGHQVNFGRKPVLNDKKSASCKRDILAGLQSLGFTYSKEPIFRLASGKMSSYYVDCRKITLHPGYMDKIGFVFHEKIAAIVTEQPSSTKGVGGLALGAVPIAIATAYEANKDNNLEMRGGQYFRPFVVRKASKEHGTKGRIVGNVFPGESVIIVDDVVTTGGSTIEAINAAREYGLNVVRAIALVDREEGGREEIEKLGVLFESVFVLSDFVKEKQSEKNTTGNKDIGGASAHGWAVRAGGCLKQEYDVKLNDGTVIENCWPNAGHFDELAGEHRSISEDQVSMIKPSTHSLDMMEET